MESHKLVILGDGGVGKTALTIQMCLNQFVETYDPTIEDSYRKQATIDGVPCVLEILDTAGQEEYTALRDQWIRDGCGFLLVYSITQRSSFERIFRFREQILRVKGTQTAPIVVVGNKCDLTQLREVSVHEGREMADKFGVDFIETSARTCFNVEQAFFNTVRQVRKQTESTLEPGNASYANFPGTPGSGADSGFGAAGPTARPAAANSGKQSKARKNTSGAREKRRQRCIIL